MDYNKIAEWELELENIALINSYGQKHEDRVQIRARQLELQDKIANERVKPYLSVSVSPRTEEKE